MNIQNVRSITSLPKVKPNSNAIYLSIIVFALIAFEFFNYSTTEFALRDLLGDLKFMGLGWATILALAFCGIDFAGIARLFSTDLNEAQQKNSWYLFGAWLLAATMNAMLTWWGVAVAVASHAIQGSAIMSGDTLTKVVPLFVAVMVWVIRVLMIGSFSMLGEKSAKPQSVRAAASRKPTIYDAEKVPFSHPVQPAPAAPKPVMTRPASSPVMARPEPTYHNLNAMSARSGQGGNTVRKM